MNADVIKYVVLAVVFVGLLMRLKPTIEGRNNSIFIALALMFLGIALSIESIYLVVDGTLGGHNYANLVIRFVVFIAFLIFGVKMAKAFSAPWAGWLIVGPVGLVVLGACAVLAIVFFVMSDLPQSSVGLHDYGNQELVQWYGRVGRIYPAYVAACLIVPAATCALSSSAAAFTRTAAAFLAAAFSIMTCYEIGRELWLVHGIWDVILPFGAAFLLAVGLILFVVARYSAQRTKRPKALPDC
ncbi:hypothetical protein [Arthrobacter roseus]|uniref:hypothetical protein n=1 Tax=Arthrobacter roseus TaxID=136274 RepID=UPI001965DD4E|nr:hypothetical protein [Arthrobacter roseus]MBM7847321.1 hypothetical protein [Arthrobacter roseus]